MAAKCASRFDSAKNDVIIPTAHSVTLQQHLPNAELVIYPDANHGSIYQYPDRFVAHAEQFLS